MAYVIEDSSHKRINILHLECVQHCLFAHCLSCFESLDLALAPGE
jgi:hypothetical protein